MAVNVRELFAFSDAEKDIQSAGKIKEISGIQERKLWQQHKMDKIDDICVKYAEKGGYAAWQNERYPILTEHSSHK